jgi:hypothetical protein
MEKRTMKKEPKNKLTYILLILVILLATLSLADYLFFNIVFSRVQYSGDALSDTEFYYKVDATTPEKGKLYIQLKMTNFPEGRWVMYQPAKNSVVAIKNFKAMTVDGEEIKLETEEDDKPLRTIINEKKQDIHITYTAEPGGRVKHGSQGLLNGEFGLFTGEVFMHFYGEIRQEKRDYQGISNIRKVRIKIDTPEGWDVYSSMKKTDEGLDPSLNGKWTFLALRYSNTAIGKFDTYEKQFGDTMHRVYLYSGWGKEQNDIIADYSFRIYNEFHKQAPFNGQPRYTTIFVPKNNTKSGVRRIMGQIWSTGQAYSYDSYSMYDGVRRRVWELYAHRISHAINRYEVKGFHTPDKFERWLDEGWASWVEITHPMNAGVVKNDKRFDRLWQWYSRVFHEIDTRSPDVPIYQEKGQDNHNIIRYLHYFKGPLLANFLDYEMRRLSGGEKDLNDFISYIYPKYNGHRKSVPLLKEINNYMGEISMDYFFDEYVKKTGYLYPLYEGFYDRYRDLNLNENSLVRMVGDYELREYQYNQLTSFLKSIKVSDQEDIDSTVNEMILVMKEYKKRGLDVIPKEMMELYPNIAGDVQGVMFEHQKDLMFDSDDDYIDWVSQQKKTLTKAN